MYICRVHLYVPCIHNTNERRFLYIHTYIHAYMRASMHACMHTYLHINTYVYIYIHPRYMAQRRTPVDPCALDRQLYVFTACLVVSGLPSKSSNPEP